MPCRDCHCDECRCIGCARIVIAGAEAPNTTGIDCDFAVDRAYNRQVTAWTKDRSGGSPFDLFESLDTGQQEEADDYPGTACRLLADLCCQPSSEDTLPDPDEPDIITPPPPPPPPPPP